MRGWLIFLHHLLGNCRAAVISFFSTYCHLFSYPRYKVQCPCVGYIFLPSSIKQLSTIQGSMSLCWTHYFIHYHLTLHHSTAHFTSIYFFNGVSLLQTGINKPIDLSTSLRFTPTVKQESSTSSVSFGVLVYYFGWVVCIFTLYMYILVLHIGEGIARFFKVFYP